MGRSKTKRVVSCHSAKKIFKRHTAREANNTHVERSRAHTLQSGHATARGFALALQSSVYTPSLYLRGRPDPTGRAGDLVVNKCMVGSNVKRGDERRLSMGSFVARRLAP
jgi:hypothetical protein